MAREGNSTRLYSTRGSFSAVRSAFCVFQKNDYLTKIVPALQGFKFQHFGHDQVILHETDIRKDRKDFHLLKSPESKAAFLQSLSQIVEEAPFTLICSVIDKLAYRQRYRNPENPYHLALAFGLEKVFSWWLLLDCGLVEYWYYLSRHSCGSRNLH